MPRRHNVILHDRVALAPAAVPLEKDMPINPVSFITITLRLLNNGANAVPTIENILGVLSNVEVLLDGKAIVSASLIDHAAVTYALWGHVPLIQPISKVDNNIINCAVHIPFTRKAWWPVEALPTARKGDLVLRITPAGTFTGVDTLTLTVEARQILDAAPERFLKYTTKTLTPTAAGPNDLDLTTGPDYVGVLFRATTVPNAASQSASIALLEMLVDDVEQHIPESRWESLHAEFVTRRDYPMLALDHVHISDLAAAYTQFQDTGRPQWSEHLLNNYIYTDFDPLMDLSYRIISSGRSRVHFRLTSDVADQVRALPIEMVYLAVAPAAVPG